VQRFYVRVQRWGEHDQSAQEQQPNKNCTVLPISKKQVVLVPELQIY
jgi:hypothetical protein